MNGYWGIAMAGVGREKTVGLKGSDALADQAVSRAYSDSLQEASILMDEESVRILELEL